MSDEVATEEGVTDAQVETEAPKEEAPQTVLEAGEGDPPVEPQGASDFPEDWRQKMAGDDAKALKTLERYTDPAAMAKALLSAQEKIRTGLKVDKPGEGASEDEIAAYRKANGIPDEASGYLDTLEGVVLSDEDKPLVEGFLQTAHAQNLPPEAVHSSINYIMQAQEDAIAAQAKVDSEAAAETVEALREEWGADYRTNVQAAKNFISATAADMPDGETFEAAIMNARLGDGSLFGNNPTALKWLASLAREANPAGFVAPANGGSQAQSIADEIAAIEKLMASGSPDYFKDDAKQARYRELIAARDKIGSRAA